MTTTGASAQSDARAWPMSSGFLAVAAVTVLLVTSACSTQEPAPTPEAFSDQVAAVIDEATGGGAGAAQLEILARAQQTGQLSVEDARAASRAGVECINNAGSSAFYAETTAMSGLVIPGYSYLGDTEEQQAIAQSCSLREDYWVNLLYQTQPASAERVDAYRAQQLPVLRACLESNGYVTDAEAGVEEVIVQALQAESDTNGAVDCITEAQID